MIRHFVQLTGQQALLVGRDRQLVFWNFWFFLILLVLFLGPLSGGDAALQVTLTAAVVTIGVMANALFSVAVGLTSARERGVFRRYWVTPAPVALPVAATICARSLVVIAAAVVQVLVARVVFGIPWTGGATSWMAVIALGTLAFAAVGFAIAAAAPSPHVANTMANLVFIPMMALGGLSLPATMMPEVWAGLYWILPAATITDGLFGAFAAGAGLVDNAGRLAYLALWTLVAAAWAARRWTRRGP